MWSVKEEGAQTNVSHHLYFLKEKEEEELCLEKYCVIKKVGLSL
jgi:hypothetical protein